MANSHDEEGSVEIGFRIYDMVRISSSPLSKVLSTNEDNVSCWPETDGAVDWAAFPFTEYE